MTEQPVAIVTAASGGIGGACAHELAERGYELILMSRSQTASTLAELLGGTGIQGSVTIADDIKRLVNLAWETHGRIDAVVNNTGHAPGSSAASGRRYDPAVEAHLLDVSDEEWHETLDLYYLNVVRMARLVTPHLQAGEGGAIVNISAFAAREPSYAYPASSTIRAALSAFTKLYADRYARDGIRMNNLLPGYLDNWDWPDALIESIPAARAGTPEEIAKTAAFLLSSDASYITGQCILADGGLNRSV